MKKLKVSHSLILQVAVFFLLGILTTGLLTYVYQHLRATESVNLQTETRASEIADEVRLSMQEYPAYEWMLQYWVFHTKDLDIEYDVDYTGDTRTEEKCRLFISRHPNFQMKYATAEELEALPAEDQKLYAEITYSWVITRLNQIKRTYHIDFIFVVLTDDSCTTQFFLFSAADPGAERGTNYEQVYPLGTRVTVNESQRNAMMSARQNRAHLADAGVYEDYYSLLQIVENHPVMIGLTYKVTDLRAAVKSYTWQGTIYAVLFQVILAAILLSMIYYFVLRPMKRVQQNIRLYKETKQSKTVIENLESVRAHNEIGVLATDVSDLAKEIDDYLLRIRSIAAERERIGTELTLATRIQASMLPSSFPAFPERTDFNIYATMDPAREVGGDFYDFFLIDDDHLCMVMADVSGKGIPAALFMMVSKIILKNNAMSGKSPAQILTDTNVALCANNRVEMFVTVWIGILELSTGKLTAANAGHEYPVLGRPDGTFELYKDKHGFVIGGMDGIRYREYELQLEPGSRLFVYTDGVPEATDAENNMFGTDRMLSSLNETGNSDPQTILENVRRSVDDFVKDAEQFDDLTMLCLEYDGQNETQP